MGLPTAHEVFADRTYQMDGSLTLRSQDDALIINQDRSILQVLKMVKEGKVISQQGTEIALQAGTVCIDVCGEQALVIARHIKKTLIQNKTNVRESLKYNECHIYADTN